MTEEAEAAAVWQWLKELGEEEEAEAGRVNDECELRKRRLRKDMEEAELLSDELRRLDRREREQCLEWEEGRVTKMKEEAGMRWEKEEVG